MISAVADFANPLFQKHLVAGLDPRKHNSNVTLSRGVGDLSHSGERPTFGRDFDSQLGSSREGFTCGHTASIQTQVRGPALKLKLRLQVHQFHAGNKGIAASSWTFNMNLYRSLNFVSHTFIVRNDPRDSGDSFYTVVELFSCGGSFAITSARLRLQPDYVCSLRSLCTLNYLEFDGFPFVQRSESVACDCGVMNKHIWSVVAPDETVPLGVVEPLNLTSHTSSSPGTAFFGIRGDLIMPSAVPYSK